jgi:hypothetical protein
MRGWQLHGKTMEETPVSKARLTPREVWMAIVIWGTAAVVGFGGLYVLGLWVDRWD